LAGAGLPLSPWVANVFCRLDRHLKLRLRCLTLSGRGPGACSTLSFYVGRHFGGSKAQYRASGNLRDPADIDPDEGGPIAIIAMEAFEMRDDHARHAPVPLSRFPSGSSDSGPQAEAGFETRPAS
jgi:hypothetical protein